ncbi:protein ORANGE, chloroplastic-like [Pyrus communis]|uniref:protein ORANGE, chloroplastic-like n=1 Tax=Pyrus communis TaxID=23211 RepID=UPI0035C04D31
MSLAALTQPDIAEEVVEAAALFCLISYLEAYHFRIYLLYIICSEWVVTLLDSICDGYVDCLEWLYLILLLIVEVSLELKLGIGGTSYKDFIVNMHLPLQLSQVDPIVASFSGGAVGVISALMVVEINNVKQQEHKRCKYCLGTGYLACARCSSTGTLVLTEPVSTVDGGNQPLSLPKTERCSNCSGAGKVMCPTCLCTGMAMASEHDPRIDPFD